MEGDRKVWLWFNENCLPAAEHYGLVQDAIRELNLSGASRYLFLLKLGAMLEMREMIRADKLEKESKRGK